MSDMRTHQLSDGARDRDADAPYERRPPARMTLPAYEALRLTGPRRALCVLLLVGGCRPSQPVRTGPLPSAHSCYRMTGLSVQASAATSTSPVWLLLSDESPKRFRARSFDAMIVDNGISTPAQWHRTSRDSLLLEWTSTSGVHTVTLHATASSIYGVPAADSSTSTPGGASISGTRVDCGLLMYPITVVR